MGTTSASPVGGTFVTASSASSSFLGADFFRGTGYLYMIRVGGLGTMIVLDNGLTRYCLILGYRGDIEEV